MVQTRKCPCLHGTFVAPSRADVTRPRPKFILSLVSQAIPIPLSSQKCLGQLQSLPLVKFRRSRARDIIPIEIFGWPVVRESHLEDPAHGRARKAPATRADAGGDRSNGYWYIRIDGKGYLGHRLAWLYMHGHFPDGLLDHKTRNPSSCRIADLRKATHSQNAANTNLRATSTSGFKGVCWHKKTQQISRPNRVSRKSRRVGFLQYGKRSREGIRLRGGQGIRGICADQQISLGC